ncbi:unnamed protein product [Knipowitschia caucasica]
MRNSSCTTEKCQWLMPSNIKKIPAAPVAMIDFTSAKRKKLNLDDAISGKADMGVRTNRKPERLTSDTSAWFMRGSHVWTVGCG